jgi:hypothetical protein
MEPFEPDSHSDIANIMWFFIGAENSNISCEGVRASDALESVCRLLSVDVRLVRKMINE